MSDALLEIEDLHLEFGKGVSSVRVLDGVSFTVASGEIVGLVGESGSGKSVTALSIGRLLPSPPSNYPSGRILVEGRNILSMSSSQLRSVRGAVVSYVFQEPGASLNPVIRIGSQIKESLKLHQPQIATNTEVVRLLQLVGIPSPELRIRNYPHELSGGMQQRVMIAMAIASRPKLLVADEPTTALDTTIQAQIIELLRDLNRQLGMAVLLITHNLGIVADLANRVAVMYAGKIVEVSSGRELIKNPLHPYTQALIKSAPRLGESNDRLAAISGSVPRIGALPTGCRFHPRCEQAVAECATKEPDMVHVNPGRWVRCPYGPSNAIRTDHSLI